MKDKKKPLFIFSEENASSHKKNLEPCWKILVITNNTVFDSFIKETCANFVFEQKNILLLQATSASEAAQILEQTLDISLMILDLDIGDSASNLKLIKSIRKNLNNFFLRIILYANSSDNEISKTDIFNYDIHNFLFKSNLDSKFFINITKTALKNFQHFHYAEEEKKQLQSIADSANRFVPYMFLSLLNKKNITEAHLSDYIEKELTILFLDIRSFSAISEFVTPFETFKLINDCMSYLEPIIIEHGGFIDKYIGDAVMALFPKKADDAVNAGIKLLQSLEEYNYSRIIKQEVPIKVGIGINTGTVVLGVVGFHERTDCTVIGDAVNVAERIEKTNKEYDSNLIISEQTFLALADSEQFAYRSLGKIHISGKKRMIKVYEIFNADIEEIVKLKKETKIEFETAVSFFHASNFSKAHKIFLDILKRNRHDHAVKFFLNQIDIKIQQAGLKIKKTNK